MAWYLWGVCGSKVLVVKLTPVLLILPGSFKTWHVGQGCQLRHHLSCMSQQDHMQEIMYSCMTCNNRDNLHIFVELQSFIHDCNMQSRMKGTVSTKDVASEPTETHFSLKKIPAQTQCSSVCAPNPPGLKLEGHSHHTQ